ncbi:hypothetical protein MKQ70_12975 [Chitinophaga sedimenti]|uniref:hypothetical protein n=1 Tax=Chitinophaga sedimenti TaxID=2033606 RepID=UPI002003A2CF|nr:hypothetical protein [Chitinophaga sedimenti]MCK7555880.1 hypothetical protein [Chitinophaga sedimenti]
MQYKLDKPVHGENGVEKYQCTIEWRNGSFIADEPVKSGGKDRGPIPTPCFSPPWPRVQ